MVRPAAKEEADPPPSAKDDSRRLKIKPGSPERNDGKKGKDNYGNCKSPELTLCFRMTIKGQREQQIPFRNDRKKGNCNCKTRSRSSAARKGTTRRLKQQQVLRLRRRMTPKRLGRL
jgi:hypothetical protein